PAGHLQRQSGKTAGGEHEADVDLRPSLRREIDGDERPKSRLHVGDAEREPIEAAPAAARGGDRRLRGQRPLRGGIVGFYPASLGGTGLAGCRCAGQDYPSGAATSLAGMARSAPAAPTTTTGSPRLYSGARRTWLRVRSKVIDPGFPAGAKFSARQSTAILRVPMPRNPPKSMMSARNWPSRLLRMMSTIRPMSSSALLRTLLPRMVETSWSSRTVAGVPAGGLGGGAAAGGAGDAGFSGPTCPVGGGDRSGVCASCLG